MARRRDGESMHLPVNSPSDLLDANSWQRGRSRSLGAVIERSRLLAADDVAVLTCCTSVPAALWVEHGDQPQAAPLVRIMVEPTRPQDVAGPERWVALNEASLLLLHVVVGDSLEEDLGGPAVVFVHKDAYLSPRTADREVEERQEPRSFVSGRSRVHVWDPSYEH
jgi:hypothetical protein